MTTVFTDAGKVAGFIVQRGRISFEAFTDEKAAGMFETLHRAATHCGSWLRPPVLMAICDEVRRCGGVTRVAARAQQPTMNSS
jgi:hypothetical protein